MHAINVALAAVFLVPASGFGQTPDPVGVPVRTIVTVEGKKGAAGPELRREDVMVYENKDRLTVTSWESVRRRPSGLDLWIVIDDGLDTGFGIQFTDLRAFIAQQPAGTRIGIGYMRNGSVAATQGLTNDHEAAAKAIRLPTGMPGISASPYISLSDLLQKWPAGDQVREVLIISSGIDPEYGSGPDNPYLNRAVEQAQRGGVVVNSIYYGGSGHFGHSYWLIQWGQNYLSQLAEETGGEFFWQGSSTPVSLSPYLKELNEHLNEQYVLTFLAKPTDKGLRKFKVSTEVQHSTLVAPARMYVAPSK